MQSRQHTKRGRGKAELTIRPSFVCHCPTSREKQLLAKRQGVLRVLHSVAYRAWVLEDLVIVATWLRAVANEMDLFEALRFDELQAVSYIGR